MDLPSSLQHKLGPLPVWVWGVIFGGAWLVSGLVKGGGSSPKNAIAGPFATAPAGGSGDTTVGGGGGLGGGVSPGVGLGTSSGGSASSSAPAGGTAPAGGGASSAGPSQALSTAPLVPDPTFIGVASPSPLAPVVNMAPTAGKASAPTAPPTVTPTPNVVPAVPVATKQVFYPGMTYPGTTAAPTPVKQVFYPGMTYPGTTAAPTPVKQVFYPGMTTVAIKPPPPTVQPKLSPTHVIL